MQKTYLMVNKDELFAVLVCNKKTGTSVYKNIGNKDSLIAFIAQHLNGFNSFDNFLLKRDYQIAKTQGEDLGKKFDRWLRAEKFDLYYLHDAFLYGTKNIFFSQAYFVPRTNNLEYSITFYTLAGRTIDIRNYIDDVRAFIVAGKLFDEPTQTMQKKKCSQIRRSHTTYSCSRRNLKNISLQKEICEEEGLHFRNKAFDKETRPRKGHHSTGWKDHKYAKQWEHNLQNRKVEVCSPRMYWKEISMQREDTLNKLIKLEDNFSFEKDKMNS